VQRSTAQLAARQGQHSQAAGKGEGGQGAVAEGGAKEGRLRAAPGGGQGWGCCAAGKRGKAASKGALQARSELLHQICWGLGSGKGPLPWRPE
jgi:hypothetical protein